MVALYIDRNSPCWLIITIPDCGLMARMMEGLVKMERIVWDGT